MSPGHNNQPVDHHEHPAEGGDCQPFLVKSTDLFRDRREIIIEHEGVCYRLRITRKGKLILHK